MLKCTFGLCMINCDRVIRQLKEDSLLFLEQQKRNLKSHVHLWQENGIYGNRHTCLTMSPTTLFEEVQQFSVKWRKRNFQMQFFLNACHIFWLLCCILFKIDLFYNKLRWSFILFRYGIQTGNRLSHAIYLF